MRHLISAALLALALTACGGSDDSAAPEASDPTSTPTSAASAPTEAPEPSSEAPASECEGLTDVSSGRPLCEFEQEASYQYRLAVAKAKDDVLAAVQEVAPWTEESDLTDLYGTCDDVKNKSPRAVDNAMVRFSGGSDEQVDEAGAEKLIDVAKQYVCP